MAWASCWNDVFDHIPNDVVGSNISKGTESTGCRFVKVALFGVHKYCTHLSSGTLQKLVRLIYTDDWQDDTTGDEGDLLYAAVVGQDGSVVMAGVGDNEFQVIKLDADGSFVWRFQVQRIRFSLRLARHQHWQLHSLRLRARVLDNTSNCSLCAYVFCIISRQ